MIARTRGKQKKPDPGGRDEGPEGSDGQTQGPQGSEKKEGPRRPEGDREKKKEALGCKKKSEWMEMRKLRP